VDVTLAATALVFKLHVQIGVRLKAAGHAGFEGLNVLFDLLFGFRRIRVRYNPLIRQHLGVRIHKGLHRVNGRHGIQSIDYGFLISLQLSS